MRYRRGQSSHVLSRVGVHGYSRLGMPSRRSCSTLPSLPGVLTNCQPTPGAASNCLIAVEVDLDMALLACRHPRVEALFRIRDGQFATMAWQDPGGRRQRQDLSPDGVQLAPPVRISVGSRNRAFFADHITGEDGVQLLAVEADRASAMTGSMQDFQGDAANLELPAVLHVDLRVAVVHLSP